MRALEQRINMNTRRITYNTRDDRIDQLSTNSESSTENDNIQREYVTRHQISNVIKPSILGQINQIF